MGAGTVSIIVAAVAAIGGIVGALIHRAGQKEASAMDGLKAMVEAQDRRIDAQDAKIDRMQGRIDTLEAQRADDAAYILVLQDWITRQQPPPPPPRPTH